MSGSVCTAARGMEGVFGGVVKDDCAQSVFINCSARRGPTCAISEGSSPRFLFIHSNWGLAHHLAPSQRNEHQSPCPPVQIEKTVSRPRQRHFLREVTWWIIMPHTVSSPPRMSCSETTPNELK